ncbi:hypothetical protein TomMM35A_18280 [Sphingobium sp. TomMM35A]
MAIEPPEPCPERDRLEAIIACCEKRTRRAAHKKAIAGQELADAKAAEARARDRLAQWHIDNPNPQGSLLEKIDHV